jgi:hypothetical protein
VAGYPRRVRTRSDWRYATEPPYHPEHQHAYYAVICDCRSCGRTHCRSCGCRYEPWKRRVKASNGSYEKRRLHRVFRRQVKHALQRELAGEEMSHNFRVSTVLGWW